MNKRDLSSPDGILRTLVAFAKTAGGIVVIGVDDGSKNVRAATTALRRRSDPMPISVPNYRGNTDSKHPYLQADDESRRIYASSRRPNRQRRRQETLPHSQYF